MPQPAGRTARNRHGRLSEAARHSIRALVIIIDPIELAEIGMPAVFKLGEPDRRQLRALTQVVRDSDG